MKQTFLLFFLFFTQSIFAQVSPSKYWITFKNKTNSPYSINNPSEFLSQRAIDRRSKQSISIKENDLPVNPSYVDSILSMGVSVINKSRWFNAAIVYTTDTDKINAINALPFVSGSKPVGLFKRKNNELTYPTPYAKKENTTENIDYGLSFTQINMIGGVCLHDSGYHGEGMEIAVIDAGYINANAMEAFDSLRANNQIIGQWDFVSGDSLIYEDDSHGTYVLSTMAGNLPGQLLGTAYKAKYYLLRSEQASSEYIIEEHNWISAAEYADSSGADIINSSLGYNNFNDPSQDHTYADMDGNTTPIAIAADIAVSKGMIVFCGAGNEGNLSWHYILSPADADSIIAVGAVDENGNHVGFSSYGPTYDGRIKPDVSAMGAGVIYAGLSGGIQSGDGTSFSSPIVAGMTACLWQANPHKKNTEIISAIKQSASLKDNPNDSIGYGIPNFCIANSLLTGVNPEVFKGDNLVSFGPNPFSNSLKGTFYSVKTQTITFQLYDIAGRKIVEEEKKMLNNDYNFFEINKLDQISPGLYFITIVGENKGYKYKLVKQ